MAFFRLDKPKRFNHIPIYYDEDKEMHDEIVRRAKKDLGMETSEEGEAYKPDVKGKFSGGDKITFNFKRSTEPASASRLITLVVLLAGILYFCYLF